MGRGGAEAEAEAEQSSAALREALEGSNLALERLKRNYATLAQVNKEDKEQLRDYNERHIRDSETVEKAQLSLEATKLELATCKVAAADCERLTAQNAALEAAVAEAVAEAGEHKEGFLTKMREIGHLRARAEELEEYKRNAAAEVAQKGKDLRAARKELAAESAVRQTEEAGRAAAEKEAANLRAHSERQDRELEAARKEVPELERRLAEGREAVVVAERQRRTAEVALAAAIAARESAESARDAADKRVATSAFEIQALAGQLVEEQSAKGELSTQLQNTSETMAALSSSEDRLERLEAEVRKEANKAKEAENRAEAAEAASAASADRIAELEKESAQRKWGWDAGLKAWAEEKAAILSEHEGAMFAERQDAAKRLEKVTTELSAEYERLSEEHAVLEQESKELREVAHRSDYGKLRAESALAEIVDNMKQELPGLDLQQALKQRDAALAAAGAPHFFLRSFAFFSSLAVRNAPFSRLLLPWLKSSCAGGCVIQSA